MCCQTKLRSEAAADPTKSRQRTDEQWPVAPPLRSPDQDSEHGISAASKHSENHYNKC